MIDSLLQSLLYTLPAVSTGLVAYYFFQQILKSGLLHQKNNLLRDQKKEGVVVKLQAHERLLLLCERINPIKLVIRVKPIGTETNDYLYLLIANIEQEFEHNTVQQLYLTDNAWTAIVAAKNNIIQHLKQAASSAENAAVFRERVLESYANKTLPTDTAIAFLKNETQKIL